MNLKNTIARSSIFTLLFIFLYVASAFAQPYLTVSNDNDQVGEFSNYYLDFETNIGTYAYINKGQLIVTLPSGFETSALDSVEVIDDYGHINYTVSKIVHINNSVYLYLRRVRSIGASGDGELGSEYPTDLSCLINVRIKLSQLQNPQQDGDYQISLVGLKYNGKIALGPLLSDPFEIMPKSVHSIIVSPSDDLTFIAGASQLFSAQAFDQNGSLIEGVVFDWGLSECTNCIGQFTDSTLYMPKTGEGVVQATVDGVFGFSGNITVTPAELAQINFVVQDSQFVGHPMLRTSYMRLYDAFHNLKYDYDLSENPIDLQVTMGELTNGHLDNSEFNNEGIVYLHDREIIYTGPSGEVGLSANVGVVDSEEEMIFYNNYDILDFQNSAGATISSVINDEQISANILIRNNGNSKAENVMLSMYWESLPENIVQLSVVLSDVGIVDTVEMSLPTYPESAIFDNLIITTQSTFMHRGINLSTFAQEQFVVSIIEPVHIEIVEGSLYPKKVYAGTNVSFQFKVNIESEKAYDFHGLNSQFKIYDDTYLSSTNLFLESDSLYPGDNILRSAVISVQPEQLGSDLFAEVEISFCVPGRMDTLLYVAKFINPVEVVELPLVQIIDLEVIAPNSPIVNSSQQIQFKASVVNHSQNVLDSVLLELKSIDGNSQIINPILPMFNLNPLDTGCLYFDVIAAPLSQSLPESFRVDFYDDNLHTLLPINNSAFLLIEEEALIDVSYRINGLENADGFIVNYGERLRIQLDVENRGTAQVADGTYQFIVNGINPISPDTFSGKFCSDSTIEFDFVAPMFDTSIQFLFVVTEYPIDINYDAPAIIINDSFEFTILTTSNNAELIVEPLFLNSNLILPGRLKEIFDFSITNNSSSSLNSIDIEYIDISIFTPSHITIEMSDIVKSGNSYFTENGEKISSTTIGSNELRFWFDGLTVAPQETKIIRLHIEFKESSYKEILLESLNSQFRATYNSGPNAGQNVIVKSISGTEYLVSYHLVFKGNSLEDSFIIENNPFNPSLQSVQFAFELTAEAPIEFQMFSLTGEEVYRAYYPAGSNGATIGENLISWNGLNNSGEMVLNGIYIASILNTHTGDYARIKVAVVK